MEQSPNTNEAAFLTKAYNFFLDIQQEIRSEFFWKQDPYFRFSRIRDMFLVYSEILEYEPVGWFLKAVKEMRPPMEAELSKDFLLFIRNLLIHFPFFKSWDEVTFTKQLINWSKPGRTIDKFLTKYAGQAEVKYRTWDEKNKIMTYVAIKFPSEYSERDQIALNSFMPEKEGILFSMSLMYRVLASQIEEIKD